MKSTKNFKNLIGSPLAFASVKFGSTGFMFAIVTKNLGHVLPRANYTARR